MAMEIIHVDQPSQKNLTTSSEHQSFACPGEDVLKMLTGKWKPQILGLATKGALRFSRLLKQLPYANKQSLSVALKELEESALLSKKVISQKPLHIEYYLTEKGRSMISIFKLASSIAGNP